MTATICPMRPSGCAHHTSCAPGRCRLTQVDIGRDSDAQAPGSAVNSILSLGPQVAHRRPDAGLLGGVVEIPGEQGQATDRRPGVDLNLLGDRVARSSHPIPLKKGAAEAARQSDLQASRSLHQHDRSART